MTVNRPLFTKEYDDVNSFTPPRESAYIYGATDEPRSEFATLLQSRSDILISSCREIFYISVVAVSLKKKKVIRKVRQVKEKKTKQDIPLNINI